MKKRNKSVLKVHDVETVFEEVTINAAVPTRLNESYAKIAREILQMVATMMDKTPQYISSVCLRKGIPVADTRAAFDLLERYKGDIDKIINEFLLAGVKTLVHFKNYINPAKLKDGKRYERALYSITAHLFRQTDRWRTDPSKRRAISDDFQRLTILVSRYVNPLPDTSHRKYIAQCRCVSCGKEPLTHAHRIREIDDEAYPLLIPLCEDCYDAPNGIDYYAVAEHYFALSQYLGRMVDDITGRTWAGFDGYKKVKASNKDTKSDTGIPS